MEFTHKTSKEEFPGGAGGWGCSVVTAVVQVRSLAGELPCALGTAKKKKINAKRKK